MPRRRTEMRKIRETLRLHFECGQSANKIASSEMKNLENTILNELHTNLENSIVVNGKKYLFTLGKKGLLVKKQK